MTETDPTKRQLYNDLKIALEVFTMLHAAPVEKNAPGLLAHRPAVAADLQSLLERIGAMAPGHFESGSR